MVRRQLGKLLAIGGVAVALAAGSLLVVQAQTATTIPMVPTGDTTLSGSVVITPQGGNQVKVDITVNGLKPNDDRASHIHSPGNGPVQANCDSNGPVVYPLNDVKADASGKGTSSTTITVDPSKGIPTAGWYVNVHQGAAPNVGSGVICARIAAPVVSGAAAAAPSPAAGGGAPAGTGGTAAPGNLPNSGDSVPTPILLGALVLAGVVLTGAGVALRRHRA